MIYGKINDDTKTLSMMIAYVIVVHDIIDLKQKSRRKNSIERIVSQKEQYRTNIFHEQCNTRIFGKYLFVYNLILDQYYTNLLLKD